MNRHIKLAFGNKFRTGKDTCCNYLHNKHGGNILRFAAPVYDIAEQIQANLGKKHEKDGKLLQFLGEGLRNVYSQDIWVQILEKKLTKCKSSIFVADLRYINEADMLRKNGFTLVQLIKDNRHIDRDPFHPSETELDDYNFDYIVDNNGTLEELYEKLEGIIKQIK